MIYVKNSVTYRGYKDFSLNYEKNMQRTNSIFLIFPNLPVTPCRPRDSSHIRKMGRTREADLSLHVYMEHWSSHFFGPNCHDSNLLQERICCTDSISPLLSRVQYSCYNHKGINKHIYFKSVSVSLFNCILLFLQTSSINSIFYAMKR